MDAGFAPEGLRLGVVAGVIGDHRAAHVPERNGNSAPDTACSSRDYGNPSHVLPYPLFLSVRSQWSDFLTERKYDVEPAIGRSPA